MSKESGDVNQVKLVGTISNVFPTNQTEKGTKYTNFVMKMTEKSAKGYEKTTTVMCCKFGDFDFTVDDYASLEGKISNKKNTDGTYKVSVVANEMKLISSKSPKQDMFINNNPPMDDFPF